MIRPFFKKEEFHIFFADELCSDSWWRRWFCYSQNWNLPIESKHSKPIYLFDLMVLVCCLISHWISSIGIWNFDCFTQVQSFFNQIEAVTIGWWKSSNGRNASKRCWGKYHWRKYHYRILKWLRNWRLVSFVPN